MLLPVFCNTKGDINVPSGKPSVLVVDDDVRILRMMQRILELEGYRVLRAGDGEAAIDVIDDEMPDLVLLDLMMPVMDGYTVCQRIREFSQVPIIMVTARGDEEGKVEGFDAGADDYVTKPFSSKELVARVKAILRRAVLWSERPEPVFSLQDLIVNFARHRVILSGQELNLTATEYKLLSCLARYSGRVLTPDQLLEKVWGEEYLGDAHLLQVNIARLRNKLGDDARNPTFILTRPGIGYMIQKKT